ncbi:Origin recognition complex subunit 2 [Schaereria dolodes]|nr:Origin recognition complex subunit 2 [Schaereria dolodes]
MTAKRKRAATKDDGTADANSTPKGTYSTKIDKGIVEEEEEEELDLGEYTPSKKSRGRPPRKNRVSDDEGKKLGTADTTTPKSKGKVLFRVDTEPGENDTTDVVSPLIHNADRSARRKSAKTLIERTVTGDLSDDNDLDGDNSLARHIWNTEELEDNRIQQHGEDEPDDEAELPETPSKRGPGRPKITRRKRSPTPPQNLPPHEQYFFQSRPGRNKTSSNTLSSSSLLSHSVYHDKMAAYTDPHTSSISFLHSLHSRSFPQWVFELDQSFSICLYGYGSKRNLVTSFATYLHSLHKTSPPPTTIIVNGYTPTITIRQMLSTLASAVFDSSAPQKLPSQPQELLDSVLAHLTARPPASSIYILINSIDAVPLRRPLSRSLLAQLSAHKSIHLLATCDTPSFALLWDNSLRERYNWVFHDTTTFVPYDDGKGTGEVGGVVDTVNELMGRKGGHGKGREGVRWVLKSLPENARGLYRILIAELLSASTEEQDGGDAGESDGSAENGGLENGATSARKNRSGEDLAGIEYRTLYQKAVEEFLCSSEMAFRTLLKEFHDHQMVVSRKDTVGTEVLGVPLRREEMEGLLEDLMG